MGVWIRDGAKGKKNHLNNFRVWMPFWNKLITSCTWGEIYAYVPPFPLLSRYMNRTQSLDFVHRTKPSKGGRGKCVKFTFNT